MTIGLALALPVGAQTSVTEETKAATQTEAAKTETSAKTKAGVKPEVQSTTGAQTETSAEVSGKKTGTSVQSTTGAKTETSAETSGKSTSDTGTSTKVEGKSGVVSQSTTVFRSGRETTERLSLHRSTRDRTSVHFSIGTHPRDWWLRTYAIVFMDGCHYYLAADGCWYPAYGFDPSCNYPVGVVYCE